MPAEIHEEIIISGLKNEPGALGRVLKVVGDAGVNLRALCAYATGPERGAAHLVVDHPAKAKAALDGAGVVYELHPALVIPVEDRPGAGAGICERIAGRGVNIEHCYATGVGGGGAATLVVRTNDNGKAMEAVA